MTDQYYENVALLLPMNGADGSTEFVDYSPNRKSVTVYGDAHIETDQSKYYGSSGYFDGSGDYLLGPRVGYGSSDFTVEAWIFIKDTARRAVFISQYISGFSLAIDIQSQKLCVWASSTGSSWDLITSDSSQGIGSITISTEQWTHIAYVRSGSTWRSFVNGVLDKELTGISGSITTSESSCVIGAFNYGNNNPSQFFGYMQDFRITIGTARYTSNFTPPAKLCGTISGTVTGADSEQTVIAVPRNYPANNVWSTQSDLATGDFSLTVPDTELCVIAPGGTGNNAMVYDSVVPV